MNLGVISLVVSIVSLCFSIYVFFKNKLYSNVAVENQLFANIVSAVSEYYKKCSDRAVFKNQTGALPDSINEEFYSSIDGVLSAYNFACMQYETTAIRQNRFIELYLNDIKTFLKKDEFKEMLNSSDKYACLKQFVQSH